MKLSNKEASIFKHNQIWNGEIREGVMGRLYKTVYCMKPPRNKRFQGFMNGTEVYLGKSWGIDGCLTCEARVRLEETICNETFVANAKLHPEARMRCDWFRKWASDYPVALDLICMYYEDKITEWHNVGKRRAEWIRKNIRKYMFFDGKIACPFCNMPWKSLPGDEDSVSFNLMFDTWNKLVTHINEYHGLVRITSIGKRGGQKSYSIHYNGDEPYDFELPKIKMEVKDLSKLIGA